MFPMVPHAGGDLDALFAEMDAALAISRAACDAVDGPAAQRLQERMRVGVRRSVIYIPG